MQTYYICRKLLILRTSCLKRNWGKGNWHKPRVINCLGLWSRNLETPVRIYISNYVRIYLLACITFQTLHSSWVKLQCSTKILYSLASLEVESSQVIQFSTMIWKQKLLFGTFKMFFSPGFPCFLKYGYNGWEYSMLLLFLQGDFESWIRKV